MNNQSRRLTVTTILLIFALLLVTQVASAQSKTFNWEDWSADITLLENGDLEVVETQTLNFQGAPFTYGYRVIPMDQGATGGSSDNITITSFSGDGQEFVQSTSQQPGTYSVSRSGDEITINWYFEPALGERTYTIRYLVEGGVRVGTAEEGDGDQVIWTVIPEDHPSGIINSRSAVIRLPEGVYPQKYTGTNDYLVAAYNSASQDPSVTINVSEDGRVITYASDSPLLPGQSFGVRAQFPHGIMDIPVPQWQPAMQRGDAMSRGLLVL
ncbi:MAG: DUF2207 domain-containing protein, partial [Candidatus Promineifilaceae bacterium]